jgi:hypothetical protein
VLSLADNSSRKAWLALPVNKRLPTIWLTSHDVKPGSRAGELAVEALQHYAGAVLITETGMIVGRDHAKMAQAYEERARKAPTVASISQRIGMSVRRTGRPFIVQ